MKILATNDDGFRAPGLWAAVDALKLHGDVCVAAPDRDHSGVGASLTLRRPLRVFRVDPLVEKGPYEIEAYSIEGTPADSAVLALEQLAGPVDLVVSGINQGSNLGEDVLISGTVGAALQGSVRGRPSIAISVGALRDTRYDVAAAFLGVVVEGLKNGVNLPPTLVNVNLPNEPVENLKGIRVTRLGRRSYGESVKEDEDIRSMTYRINRDVPLFQEQEQEEGTDIWAALNKMISVTPISTGLTDDANIPLLKKALEGCEDRLLGG